QPSPTQIRVRVKISDEAFNNQRPSNFNDYIGFFRVADLLGRIDTNGDGAGDLSPGDKGYANAARTQALVGKFMLSDAAGQDQASGPDFLRRCGAGLNLCSLQRRRQFEGRPLFHLPGGE
ncbi:MAG: hypothetical protein AAFY84_16400, partial [Pseudomonadota bacterium]